MTGFIEHVRSLARRSEAAKSARDMRSLAHKRKMWVTVSPVKAILDIIYKNARLPLFHAKEGRTVFIPQNSPGEREAVTQALRVLTLLVTQMAEAWLNSRRATGWVSEYYIHQAFTQILQSGRMLASSDESD